MSMLPPSGRPQMTRAQVEAVAVRHGINPATDKIYVVGFRGYFPKSMGPTSGNDRGTYDDALFLVTPDYFGAFNGNTDPSRFRAGVGTGAAKGIASLIPGLYRVHRFDIHNGKYMALCERAGPVRVMRDGNPPYEDVGSFGINIHRGGDGTTSSLGCQTIPPAQWPEFYSRAEGAAKQLFGSAWRATVIPYLLVDKAAEDAATAGNSAAGGQSAPGTPQDTPAPASGASGPEIAPQPAPEWGAAGVAAVVGGMLGGFGGVLGALGAAAQEAAAAPAPSAGGGMMTPRAFIAWFIGQHEGELSVHPDDNGNWFDPARYRARLPQRRGMGVNVGSKFGVTAYALAAYRVRNGMPLDQALNITRETMAGLDFETAVDVGVELYFKEPGFDRLRWNRVTMSILDKAWGSGPGTAIDMLQGMIGADLKGGIGPETASKYAAFLDQYGEEGAAHRWADVRIAFDQHLATNEGANDPDRKFVNGWNNRTRSFLPGTTWWRQAGGEG